MINRQHRPDLSDLFIRLLGCDEIVKGKDDACKIPHPFLADAHCTPESCIHCCRDPCCSEVGSCVEVREWFGTLKVEEFTEISCNVEVEEGHDEGLPWREDGGDVAGQFSQNGRAVFMTAGRSQ